MCHAEGGMLQRGMTFRAPPNHGVILMSQRPNAPYVDAMDAEWNLLYEGHDAPRTAANPEPKQIDQPRYTANGRPTENGKFADWTDRHLSGAAPPALFHVYEKLRDGIWTFRGPYALKGYHFVEVRGRRVFRFLLSPLNTGETAELRPISGTTEDDAMTRRIPTWVKQAVYKRDRGMCVICGSTTELLPFSRGGTGLTPDNVRILCARHNLSKGGRIQ
jgi:hypothetical protein